MVQRYTSPGVLGQLFSFESSLDRYRQLAVLSSPRRRFEPDFPSLTVSASLGRADNVERCESIRTTAPVVKVGGQPERTSADRHLRSNYSQCASSSSSQRWPEPPVRECRPHSQRCRLDLRPPPSD